MGSKGHSITISRPGTYFLLAAALTLLWLALLSRNALRMESEKSGVSAIQGAGKSMQIQKFPVYPYSVISGGVHSRADLVRVLAGDGVVSAHYSDFRARDAYTIALTADKLAYVSFRVRNEIYWTKKRILLPKGELVITDGEHSARERCGNRISDVPQSKTMRNEPAESLLDLSASELSFFQEHLDVAMDTGSGTSPEASIPLTPVPFMHSGQPPNDTPEWIVPGTPAQSGTILAAPSPGNGSSSPPAVTMGNTPASVLAPQIDIPAPQPAPLAGSYLSPETVPATPQISPAFNMPPGSGRIVVPGYVPPFSRQQPVFVPMASEILADRTIPLSATRRTPSFLAPVSTAVSPAPEVLVPARQTEDTTPQSGTTSNDIPAPAGPVPTLEPGTLLLLGSSLAALLIAKGAWRL